jgi:hypothetical protein
MRSKPSTKAAAGEAATPKAHGHKKLFAVRSSWGFKPGVLAIFALIIGAGGLYILFSKAAPTPPTVYLSPASQSFKAGATFSVQVRENSGTTGVNAVQANFSYPTSLVTCTSIDASASVFGIEAQATCSAGQVTIGRGISGGSAPLTGDQLVATVNFTVGVTGGSAVMAFTSGTALVSASTNQDILGSLAATAGATYTIDVSAPTASVTAPGAGSFVGGSSIAVTAASSDNTGVAGVQFKLDGANLGAEDTSSPYAITWNTGTAANGSHTLTAVSRDAAGNTTTSAGVTVTVDNAAPAVSITAPSSGSSVTGTTTITASASDNTGGAGVAKVEFYIDGSLKSTDTTAPYSYAWDSTTSTAGSHTLSAKAYDNATSVNVATSSNVTVTVVLPDTQSPTTPGNLSVAGTTVTSASLSWSASTDNVGVTGYQIRRNGTLVTTATGLTYTDSSLTSSTSYSYTVTAIDAAGNVSAAAGPVTGITLATIPGDDNGDGHVNVTDLSVMLTYYSTSYAPCDFNGDGTVNVIDLSTLLTNYGR